MRVPFRNLALDEQQLIAPPLKDHVFWRDRTIGRPAPEPAVGSRLPLREFGPAEGERYFICQATGYDMALPPRHTGRKKDGSRHAVPVSYSVIDSAYDKEIAQFSPSIRGGGRDTLWCKKQAETLCAVKNQDERDWENGEGEYAPWRPTPVKRCKRGHPYSGTNLYVHAGKRYCRACRLLRKQPWWKRKPSV